MCTPSPPTCRTCGPVVGALPDQLEFSKDCRTIVVSNEGEPETYTPASLANDPEGSVSIIDLQVPVRGGQVHHPVLLPPKALLEKSGGSPAQCFGARSMLT